MRISIFGLGYVGTVSLACLVRDGHDVVGVDIDQNKLDLVEAGKSPIIEDGIQQLMSTVKDTGRLTTTDNTGTAISGSDISFVCVGTPCLPNGDQDLSAVQRLMGQIGPALAKKSDYHLIVIRSTIRPGTVNELLIPLLEESSGKQHGQDFDVCFQPEFLREGSSIKDYDNPPFTIVGTDSNRAAGLLKDLFGHLPCDFLETSISTAEMMKYACNTFHAVKVTFANEIARISQAIEVNPHEVMDLVCRDKRLNISPAYLKPGFAYGGSCLPKDLRALNYMAKSNDVDVPMLGSVGNSNQIHIDQAVNLVLQQDSRKIGMIGLSFKSGTDDLRESPLVTVAERLIGKGMELEIFDPEVSVSRLVGANRSYIENSIPHIGSLMRDSCADVIERSDVVIVGLNNPDLLSTVVEHTHEGQLVIDLVNMNQKDALRARYQGICW